MVGCSLLLGGAIYANWYYGASQFYIAHGYDCGSFGGRVLLLRKLKRVRAVVELAIGARTELRKVVWPTKQERNQTTLIVVAVILLMSLILWGIDSLLSWGAAQIMG